MDSEPRSVTWEAPEHIHFEKSTDWFWILGIITAALVVVFILIDNLLLSIVVALGGFFVGILGNREPQIVPFAATTRGIRINDRLYPYSTLRSYHINEEDVLGPTLLITSKRLFMPLLVIPLPEDYLDEVEDLVGARLQPEDLEEPFSHKLLEFFGF